MIKKEVFENVGGFKEWMRSCEDYDMWLRIAEKYHIYYEIGVTGSGENVIFKNKQTIISTKKDKLESSLR